MLCDMQRQLTKSIEGAIRRNMGKTIFVLAPVMTLVLGACVQVQAPDKPIVINLNVAIKQEVLVKLEAAANKVVNENPGVF